MALSCQIDSYTVKKPCKRKAFCLFFQLKSSLRYYSREHQNQAIPSFRLASVVFSVFGEGLSGGEDFFHREWISSTQSHQRLHLIDSFSAAGFCVRFYDGIVDSLPTTVDAQSDRIIVAATALFIIVFFMIIPLFSKQAFRIFSNGV